MAYKNTVIVIGSILLFCIILCLLVYGYALLKKKRRQAYNNLEGEGAVNAGEGNGVRNP
jgi:cbb3-type cytochrome oxidase subunit 3